MRIFALLLALSFELSSLGFAADFTRDAMPGDGTGERNFLPFIPWLAARKPVRTFDVPDAREALGVNTAADLAQMEQFLREHV